MTTARKSNGEKTKGLSLLEKTQKRSVMERTKRNDARREVVEGTQKRMRDMMEGRKTITSNSQVHEMLEVAMIEMGKMREKLGRDLGQAKGKRMQDIVTYVKRHAIRSKRGTMKRKRRRASLKTSHDLKIVT
jgi:hypothetical protein